MHNIIVVPLLLIISPAKILVWMVAHVVANLWDGIQRGWNDEAPFGGSL